ncbi:MAG: hypothetical protein U5K79_19070 [Cyclobacteriaceae bacterium]|nr:hypothetical protein [Cyclobacteriaceae bacterium]
MTTQWLKNEPQNPWKLQTTSIATRKTLYTEDSLVIDRVITNEYPEGDWRSYSLYTTTEHNEYNCAA